MDSSSSGNAPRPAKPPQNHPGMTIGGIILAILIILSVFAVADPRADIPVISPIVCSLKGGAWYGGGILAPPGCYRAW
jgi:hypothetical protein